MKIKIGEQEVDTGFRSVQQIATVQAIAARPEFKFAVVCAAYDKKHKIKPNLGDLGGSPTYKGSFAFLWYNKQEQLTISSITWTGKILMEQTAK